MLLCLCFLRHVPRWASPPMCYQVSAVASSHSLVLIILRSPPSPALGHAAAAGGLRWLTASFDVAGMSSIVALCSADLGLVHYMLASFHHAVESRPPTKNARKGIMAVAAVAFRAL